MTIKQGIKLSILYLFTWYILGFFIGSLCWTVLVDLDLLWIYSFLFICWKCLWNNVQFRYCVHLMTILVNDFRSKIRNDSSHLKKLSLRSACTYVLLCCNHSIQWRHLFLYTKVNNGRKVIIIFIMIWTFFLLANKKYG